VQVLIFFLSSHKVKYLFLQYCDGSQQTLIDANKEVCLEVNTEETKYMLLSHHQNAEQNHDISIENRCFKNVAQFRYLGTMIANQNLIEEEIKRRLNSDNACYHSVQYLLSSRLLSRNLKIRIYKTYNFACGSVWIRNLVFEIKGGT
jgi:hypothetical protein